MERKVIAKVLGEHFGVEPQYMGVPSFAYQIETAEETYTVDRAGKITTSEGKEVELERLLNARDVKETTESTAEKNPEYDIIVPMDGHTGITLRNLVNMIYSKQSLIKKTFEFSANIIDCNFCKSINETKIESLDDFKVAIERIGEEYCPGIVFNFSDNSIILNFLEGDVSSDKIRAYSQFVGLLNQSAKTLNHVSAKVNVTDNDKFTFRAFLIRLGMIGNEYKVARKVLLENLEGNAAYKSGAKPEKVADPE